MREINDVNHLYGECIKCGKHLEANRGDTIVIDPQFILGVYELIVLCKKCWLELEEDE